MSFQAYFFLAKAHTSYTSFINAFADLVVVVWEEQRQLLLKKATNGVTKSGKKAFSEHQYKLQPAIAMVGEDLAGYADESQ